MSDQDSSSKPGGSNNEQVTNSAYTSRQTDSKNRSDSGGDGGDGSDHDSSKSADAGPNATLSGAPGVGGGRASPEYETMAADDEESDSDQTQGDDEAEDEGLDADDLLEELDDLQAGGPAASVGPGTSPAADGPAEEGDENGESGENQQSSTGDATRGSENGSTDSNGVVGGGGGASGPASSAASGSSGEGNSDPDENPDLDTQAPEVGPATVERFEDNDVALTRAEMQDDEVIGAYVDAINKQAVGEMFAKDDHVPQVQSLADADLTPDRPAHLDPSAGTEYKPIAFSGIHGGMSDRSMWKVTTEDGDAMYVTLKTQGSAGKPLENAAVLSEVQNELPDAVADEIGYPDVAADTERAASVLEDVGGADSDGAVRYDPSQTSASFEKEDYLTALSGKLLLGDMDIIGNIVTSSDGQFHPIDFDQAGASLRDRDDQLKQHPGRNNATGVWEYASARGNRALRNHGFNLEPTEVKERTESIADQIDIDTLEQRFEDNPSIGQSQSQEIINNIESLQERDL